MADELASGQWWERLAARDNGAGKTSPARPSVSFGDAVQPAVPGVVSQLLGQPLKFDRSIKQAFYNTGALIFVAICCGAAVLVFFILEAFLRPLLWAVLCGTFLHPFKHSLGRIGRCWLSGLRDSGTPIVLGTVLLPVWFANRGVEALGGLVLERLGVLLAVGAGAPLLCFLYYSWSVIGMQVIIGHFCSAVCCALDCFGPLWVGTVVLGYLLAVIFKWTPSTEGYLRVASVPVWTVLLFYLVSLTGSWRVPVFVVVVILLVVGSQQERASLPGKGELSGQVLSIAANTIFMAISCSHMRLGRTREAEEEEPTPTRNDATDSPSSGRSHRVRPELYALSHKKASDIYFVLLAWAIVLVQIWLNLWILQLLPIPVAGNRLSLLLTHAHAYSGHERVLFHFSLAGGKQDYN